MNDALGKTAGTELHRPGFVALAQSFGVPATATDPASLVDDLQTAWLSNGPNVLVLHTTLSLWQPTHRDAS